ncbi:hypothetical protein [Phaeovulum vinaykumarii]|uniref:Uncharacterized protein n=1 Tax=Phaeovulum vinaykumarii TaxID=407234 RepID=A0A1N7K422_9RHOB|nr:hypothetical protein [Phaeovulum vinaykumarii]SIS56352.1 hypothetical protein SAMN05421795_101597 [Phaeovulum vinaykumarii]SOB92827.1 hypothetical protein SAMN05878426_101595 [Phaeovulum vinaykumarii]
MTLTPETIAALFTRDDSYRFARWTRPIVPCVFGADDATLAAIKGGIEAVVTLAGHRMAETDAEMGANLWVFLIRDWAELDGVPELGGLIEGIGQTAQILAARGASRYAQVRFEAEGAIRAVFLFVRVDEAAPMAAEDLALELGVTAILDWARPPVLGLAGDRMVVPPDLASLIRAAYDPVLPAASADPAHALRLFARVAAAGAA